jgi:hypothetical protein
MASKKMETEKVVCLRIREREKEDEKRVRKIGWRLPIEFNRRKGKHFYRHHHPSLKAKC